MASPQSQSTICTQPVLYFLFTYFLSLPDPIFPLALAFTFLLPVPLVSPVSLDGGRRVGGDGIAFQCLSEQLRGVSCVLHRN